MFTGLVESCRPVTAVRARPDAGIDLDVDLGPAASPVALGESIAVSGVCLTAVNFKSGIVTFELSPETLARTAFGAIAAGSLVNIERSLRLGDRLGGHWVQGHVDGVGTVRRLHVFGEWAELDVELPQALARYCVEKGSIALDGVSLTIARLAPSGAGMLMITIALVPHTLEITTLGRCAPGAPIHVEVDIVAKYVETLVAPYGRRP
jgi:riboflavin synthase